MTKSDMSLDKLMKDPAYTPQKQPAFSEGTQINGLDSETADGKLFMISYRLENYDSARAIHNDGEFLEPEQVWKVLTNRNLRSAINVWYNLDFDASVVLSGLFGERALTEIATAGSVGDVEDGDDYEVTYIPGKFMMIKDSNSNSYYHYDASQFFYTSLDNAAAEWLGERKEEGVDTSKFGKLIGPRKEGEPERVNDYIKSNYRTIEKYARKDADLVYKLWKEATEIGEGIDIPMGKPFSTGYLGEQYMNEKLDEKPGVGPNGMASMAWESYAGGRFEVYERGRVGEVVGLDINSAYPYQLANLPDPKSLVWQHADYATVDDLRECDYGFVEAKVTTDSDRRIQPFAMKIDDVVKFPALDGVEITSVKDIFVHAVDEGIVTDYEITDAWLGYDNDGARYPFSFLKDLYKKRKEYEADGYEKRAKLLKIVMNSMYGKLCQITVKRRPLTDTYQTKPYEQFVSTLALPDSILEKYPNGIIETFKCGQYFNPFLASYITGLTRLQLHKSVVSHGLEDDTVMLATDCAMMKAEPYANSDFESLFGDTLGMWDYDYKGDAFVIGAGVYEVVSSEGIKMATRGFREADMTHGIQAELIRGGGKLNVDSERPIGVTEAMWMGESADDVGVFKHFNRQISPDMDTKRKWPELEDGFRTMMEGSQYGEPVVVDE